ncbi:MAG: type IV pilin-like G/H family protein [Prochloraceae cyanobacterium]
MKFTNLQQLDYHEKNDNFTTEFKEIWQDGSGTDSSIDYQKAYYFYQIEADGKTAKVNAIPKQEHLLSIASAVTKYDTAEGSDKIVEIICLAERPGTKDLVQALPPSMLNPVGSCINGKPITR